MQTGGWNKSNSNRKRSYLGNKIWWDLSKRYALAQLDFPNGIGVWRVIALKDRLIGYGILLEQIPPEQLEELLYECISEYRRLERKQEGGTKVDPDILPPQKNNMATTRARKQRSRRLVM